MVFDAAVREDFGSTPTDVLAWTWTSAYEIRAVALITAPTTEDPLSAIAIKGRPGHITVWQDD